LSADYVIGRHLWRVTARPAIENAAARQCRLKVLLLCDAVGSVVKVTLFVFMVVFASMIVEARRAAANERAQLARGGLEARGDVYRIMRGAYPAAFLIMLIEGLLRRDVSPLFPVGALLLAVAKALKWWAILSLGRCWTFRVIVVPGSALVMSGPYRLIRHPNYVAVVGELAGVALMTGARIAGPLAILGFSALMLRRIAVENRALDAILRRG
jgi:methyltransferase